MAPRLLNQSFRPIWTRSRARLPYPRKADLDADFPPIPQSETRFDSTAGTIEFSVDASGRVTHLILSAAEGDARYVRIR